MEAKPAQQNIQDSFLNTARKERHNITIYLVSGVKLTGRIRSFDKYSVVSRPATRSNSSSNMRFQRWSSRAEPHIHARSKAGGGGVPWGGCERELRFRY